MYTRMLVPLDGTRRSAMVVPHAIHAAKNLGCAVKLVHVIASGKSKTQGKGDGRATKLNEVVAQAAEVEEYLQSVSKRFDKTGIMTWTEVRSGDPVAEIKKAAREFEADLIAMATRCRPHLEKLVFGSVADQLLKQSEIPVLLVTAR